jgi:osmotically-inducible protein OsmY
VALALLAICLITFTSEEDQMHNRFGREDIRRRMSQRGFGQDRELGASGHPNRAAGQRRESEAYDDDDRYAQEQGYEGGDYESGRQRAEEQGRRFMQETWRYAPARLRSPERLSRRCRRRRSALAVRRRIRRRELPVARAVGSVPAGAAATSTIAAASAARASAASAGYAGSGSSQGGRGQGGFGGGQHAGRGPSDYRRNDERIREDVCDELTDDSHLDATHIQVKVENGEVTLTGTVADRQQKRRAEDIAEGARGVSDVRNELRVQNESQSRSSQDRQQQSKSGASPKNI